MSNGEWKTQCQLTIGKPFKGGYITVHVDIDGTSETRLPNSWAVKHFTEDYINRVVLDAMQEQFDD